MFFAVKSDSNPASLASICVDCICQNLDKVFVATPSGLCLQPDMKLPREICESLLHEYQRLGNKVDDDFANLFADRQSTTLQEAVIWNSSITDAGLFNILKHNLYTLDLAYCKELTPASFHVINRFGKNLRSLSLGNDVNIMAPHHQLRTPNLTRLVVRNITARIEPNFYDIFLLMLTPKLTHLDLSNCFDISALSFISYFSNLTSLVLCNCSHVERLVDTIYLMKNLRHLDISTSDEGHGEFSDENRILKKLVESLPNLVSLDISGTNLAGKGNVVKDFFDESRTFHSDIPGLASRADNPLEFLGLYGTHHRACKRHHIPAVKIAGDSNEDQLVTAAIVYMNRPHMLQRVLNDLFHFLRADVCVNISKVLRIILEALNMHASHKFIQISGSAALFYIVRNKNHNLITANVRKLIISTLINSMQLHRTDETMLRNGCLTLCQFQIPQDILFKYNPLVELLLHIIMDKEQEGFVQRIGIYLMNSLACQVDDSQKEVLGNLGIIEKMLTLIRNRIDKKLCDDVMEVSWSTMWNVTDETPVNCQRFLDADGMICFMACLENFRQKNELMRNMMGLLGNVAEVKELRGNLMEYVGVFSDLLNSFQDGIEVGYNAAGVISHIASDGPEVWTCSRVERAIVLEKMVTAIEKWDIGSDRNINYHSFEPILKLTRVHHTPECQHWAIWALTNLTTVYPMKYCPILEAECGLDDVQALIDDSRPYPRIKELAKIVLNNYATYKNSNQENQNEQELMNTGE